MEPRRRAGNEKNEYKEHKEQRVNHFAAQPGRVYQALKTAGRAVRRPEECLPEERLERPPEERPERRPEEDWRCGYPWRPRINENGETEYAIPLEYMNEDDLDAIHIPQRDRYRLMRFGYLGQRFFIGWTTDYEAAIAQRKYFDALQDQAKVGYRCIVPGVHKDWILCDRSNTCSRCPYEKDPSQRVQRTVSYEKISEKKCIDSCTDRTVEDMVIFKMMMEEAYDKCMNEDIRIWPAMLWKLFGVGEAQVLMESFHIGRTVLYELAERGRRIVRDTLKGDEL